MFLLLLIQLPNLMVVSKHFYEEKITHSREFNIILFQRLQYYFIAVFFFPNWFTELSLDNPLSNFPKTEVLSLIYFHGKVNCFPPYLNRNLFLLSSSTIFISGMLFLTKTLPYYRKWETNSLDLLM